MKSFQQICPIFPSMFSDLPHCPRQQVVMRKADEPLPAYGKNTTADLDLSTWQPSKDVDIHGVDRHRFFFRFVREEIGK